MRSARATIHADAAFVHALEAQLPAAAQIFQLPYLRFPESGALPGTKLDGLRSAAPLSAFARASLELPDDVRPPRRRLDERRRRPAGPGAGSHAVRRRLRRHPRRSRTATRRRRGDRRGAGGRGAAPIPERLRPAGTSSSTSAPRTRRPSPACPRSSANAAPAGGAGPAAAALARRIFSARARPRDDLPLVLRRLRDRDRQSRRARDARVSRVDAACQRRSRPRRCA